MNFMNIVRYESAKGGILLNVCDEKLFWLKNKTWYYLLDLEKNDYCSLLIFESSMWLNLHVCWNSVCDKVSWCSFYGKTPKDTFRVEIPALAPINSILWPWETFISGLTAFLHEIELIIEPALEFAENSELTDWQQELRHGSSCTILVSIFVIIIYYPCAKCSGNQYSGVCSSLGP